MRIQSMAVQCFRCNQMFRRTSTGASTGSPTAATPNSKLGTGSLKCNSCGGSSKLAYLPFAGNYFSSYRTERFDLVERQSEYITAATCGDDLIVQHGHRQSPSMQWRYVRRRHNCRHHLNRCQGGHSMCVDHSVAIGKVEELPATGELIQCFLRRRALCAILDVKQRSVFAERTGRGTLGAKGPSASARAPTCGNPSTGADRAAVFRNPTSPAGQYEPSCRTRTPRRARWLQLHWRRSLALRICTCCHRGWPPACDRGQVVVMTNAAPKPHLHLLRRTPRSPIARRMDALAAPPKRNFSWPSVVAATTAASAPTARTSSTQQNTTSVAPKFGETIAPAATFGRMHAPVEYELLARAKSERRRC